VPKLVLHAAKNNMPVIIPGKKNGQFDWP